MAFDDDGDDEEDDFEDDEERERCPECGATLSEEHAIDCSYGDEDDDDGDGL